MDKELAESIGTAARSARTALKLTQEDAAERIGVSAEFYARIERGNALPSVPTLARISTSLGVSADSLLGRAAPLSGDSDDGDEPPRVPAPAQPPAPAPPADGPELRRLARRLRKASPVTLRLVALLVKELERTD
jgi:transcriptional regulator with XRE-family HTH domain